MDPFALSASFKAHFQQLRDASRPSLTTPLHTRSLNGNLEGAARILQMKHGDPNVVDSVRACALSS